MTHRVLGHYSSRSSPFSALDSHIVDPLLLPPSPSIFAPTSATSTMGTWKPCNSANSHVRDRITVSFGSCSLVICDIETRKDRERVQVQHLAKVPARETKCTRNSTDKLILSLGLKNGEGYFTKPRLVVDKLHVQPGRRHLETYLSRWPALHCYSRDL